MEEGVLAMLIWYDSTILANVLQTGKLDFWLKLYLHNSMIVQKMKNVVSWSGSNYAKQLAKLIFALLNWPVAWANGLSQPGDKALSRSSLFTPTCTCISSELDFP